MENDAFTTPGGTDVNVLDATCGAWPWRLDVSII